MANMFWMAVIAWGVICVTALAGALVFFAGAALGSERWDKTYAEFREARSNQRSAA
jgi:hypothetical protein